MNHVAKGGGIEGQIGGGGGDEGGEEQVGRLNLA